MTNIPYEHATRIENLEQFASEFSKRCEMLEELLNDATIEIATLKERMDHLTKKAN